ITRGRARTSRSSQTRSSIESCWNASEPSGRDDERRYPCRGDRLHGERVRLAGDSPPQRRRAGDRPPVGENLCDHVGTGMAWEPTDELRADWDAWEREHPLAMAAVTVPLRSSSCPECVCNLFAFPAADPGYEISAGIFAMKPLSRGRV